MDIGLLLLRAFAVAAAAIIGVMLSAAVIVHARNGFFNTNGGVELPAMLGIAAVSVALTGPGAFALDAVLGLALASTGWALAGIVLGVAAAALVVGCQRIQSRTRTRQQVRTA